MRPCTLLAHIVLDKLPKASFMLWTLLPLIFEPKLHKHSKVANKNAVISIHQVCFNIPSINGKTPDFCFTSTLLLNAHLPCSTRDDNPPHNRWPSIWGGKSWKSPFGSLGWMTHRTNRVKNPTIQRIFPLEIAKLKGPYKDIYIYIYILGFRITTNTPWYQNKYIQENWCFIRTSRTMMGFITVAWKTIKGKARTAWNEGARYHFPLRLVCD